MALIDTPPMRAILFTDKQQFTHKFRHNKST